MTKPHLEDAATSARIVEAVNAVARLSRQLERAAGEVNLAQYRVLAAVRAGDDQASRLAARLAMGKPTVSATVDALCRRGLMIRTAVEGDQRALALTLTDEGRQTLGRVERAMVAKLSDLTAAMSDGRGVVDALAALGVVMAATAPDVTSVRR